MNKSRQLSLESVFPQTWPARAQGPPQLTKELALAKRKVADGNQLQQEG
jgi:hypothetical protein